MHDSRFLIPFQFGDEILLESILTRSDHYRCQFLQHPEATTNTWEVLLSDRLLRAVHHGVSQFRNIVS